jgi:transcriptional regulator with XRE-family HTH domain
MSQLDLSASSGVTPRHVSFVETGRSTPSRELLHTLADALEMPLRDRNTLFLAAGYAPPYRDHGLDDPDASDVADAIERILSSHDPLPGVVVDRHWNLIRANHGAQQLFGQLLDLDSVEPPINVLRLVFGPLRPVIDNWAELAPSLLARARRESVGGVPDPELEALLDDLTTQLPTAPHPNIGHGPVISAAFRIAGTVHRYFSTVTTLGTALDIDLQELRIELFHPATNESPIIQWLVDEASG